MIAATGKLRASGEGAQRMRTASWSATVAATFAVVAGCAHQPSTKTDTYYKPTVAAEDAALVDFVHPMFIWPWQDQISTWVDKVDGMQCDPRAPPNLPHPLDPGERLLTVGGHYCRHLSKYCEVGEVDLKTSLLPRHSYQLAVEFGDGVSTFWIVDEGTHELASERVSTKTSNVKIHGSLNVPVFPPL